MKEVAATLVIKVSADLDYMQKISPRMEIDNNLPKEENLINLIEDDLDSLGYVVEEIKLVK